MTFRRAVLGLVISGMALVAADHPTTGTWKLVSQKSLEGNAPSFPIGAVMTLNGEGRPAKTDRPMPASMVGHDRIREILAQDRRTMTWESSGVDDQSGKAYRYVLLWEKQ
jgi:hypothetical protein